MRREGLLFKKLVPCLLRMQRCVVDDGSSFRFSILAGKNAELLFRAGIVAREAKQLKQENACAVSAGISRKWP